VCIGVQRPKMRFLTAARERNPGAPVGTAGVKKVNAAINACARRGTRVIIVCKGAWQRRQRTISESTTLHAGTAAGPCRDGMPGMAACRGHCGRAGRHHAARPARSAARRPVRWQCGTALDLRDAVVAWRRQWLSGCLGANA